MIERDMFSIDHNVGISRPVQHLKSPKLTRETIVDSISPWLIRLNVFENIAMSKLSSNAFATI